MDALSHAAADAEKQSLRLITRLMACCMLLLLIVPMASPALLPLCAAIPLAKYWSAQRYFPLRRPSAPVVALAVVGVYLLINASWSLSPGTAYRAVVLFIGIAVGAYFLVNILYETDDAALRAMAAGVVAAMVVGGFVLCIETFTGQALRRLVMHYLTAFQSNVGNTQVEGPWATRLAPHLINRSMSALTLLFWSTVLIIDHLDLSRRHRLWILMALAPGPAAIAASQHGTSKVAFVGAAATYGMFRLYPSLGRRVVLAGWTALTLLVVPGAMLLYAGQYYHATWLANSAQHRVVIWGYTAEQVAKAPFLGVGIGSARALSDLKNENLPKAPGTQFQLSTSLHSHNAYLQIWFETGAVGAFILLGLGFLVLRALRSMPWQAQPHLHATFAACALLAASSFSIWAPWFVACLAIACIPAALGAVLSGRRGN